jgi:hypothetical protein
MRTIEEIAPRLRYWPQGQGPKFFVHKDDLNDLMPYLRGLCRKYPHVGTHWPLIHMPGEGWGHVFGPDDDVALDKEISAKFGVPPSVGAPDASGLGPEASRKRPKDDVPVNYGRGRPEKYHFKSLEKIGDSFLVLDGSLPHIRSAGCKYITRYRLDGVAKFEYIRTRVGILVVRTVSEDDSVSDNVVSYHAD